MWSQKDPNKPRLWTPIKFGDEPTVSNHCQQSSLRNDSSPDLKTKTSRPSSIRRPEPSSVAYAHLQKYPVYALVAYRMWLHLARPIIHLPPPNLIAAAKHLLQGWYRGFPDLLLLLLMCCFRNRRVKLGSLSLVLLSGVTAIRLSLTS